MMPPAEHRRCSLSAVWLGLLAVWLCLAVVAHTEANEIAQARSGTRFEKKMPLAPAHPTATPPRAESAELPKSTNIHFSGRYCGECHAGRTNGAEAKVLKYNGNFRFLCRCHFDTESVHAHPVDSRPDKSSGITIPTEFPLNQGQMSCLTCHNVFIQCRDSEADKVLLKGQKFLRGMPYKSSLDFCFRCHETNRYVQRDPHKQIDAQGRMITAQCIYCHTDVPDAQTATYREVKLIGNYGALCKGCHYATARQPMHSKHLRKPSREVVERMKQMQEQYNMVLPLDQEGKVTCVTCHNPHQKGLIPDQRAGTKGAGTTHRHRLEGNMCIKCHPMR